jgi:hypothetical protein
MIFMHSKIESNYLGRNALRTSVEHMIHVLRKLSVHILSKDTDEIVTLEETPLERAWNTGDLYWLSTSLLRLPLSY